MQFGWKIASLIVRCRKRCRRRFKSVAIGVIGLGGLSLVITQAADAAPLTTVVDGVAATSVPGLVFLGIPGPSPSVIEDFDFSIAYDITHDGFTANLDFKGFSFSSVFDISANLAVDTSFVDPAFVDTIDLTNIDLSVHPEFEDDRGLDLFGAIDPFFAGKTLVEIADTFSSITYTVDTSSTGTPGLGSVVEILETVPVPEPTATFLFIAGGTLGCIVRRRRSM